jgi:hypothetical protein
MIRRTKCGWTAMTILGLLAGAANADDGGTAGNTGVPMPATNSGPAPAVNSGDKVVGGETSFEMRGDVGVFRLGSCLQNIMAYNPAAGYRPPETVPIARDAVIYHRYWPAKWYGQPGWRLAPTFPMVYMPTDTTQLGVYYSRVPQWLPNPGMYPRPPRPDEWNRRVTNADLAGANCNGGIAVGYGGPRPASGPTPAEPPSPPMLPGAQGKPQPIPQRPATPQAPPRPQAQVPPPPAPLGAVSEPQAMQQSSLSVPQSN